MKLCITTPLAIVLDEQGIVALRAEDATGSFGILPHHADFLTSLTLSVLAWHGADNVPHYCAVRQGALSVTAGDIAIATREAVLGDNLATLHDAVLARFRSDAEADRNDRAASTQLQLNAIRHIISHLQSSGSGRPSGFA
jgi:F-type H+-transporting ATPase subunit epsilon